MTDISRNWYDLSFDSNNLKQTYFYNGFIDVSSNIVGQENLWIKNETDVGDTRLGLGTLEPYTMIDVMSNQPKIRFTNTSITGATQNVTNLGTINIVSPSNNNLIAANIICQNISTDWDDHGSLIFTNDSDNANIEDKDKIILTSNGALGVGIIPSTTLNTSVIQGPSTTKKCVVVGNIESNKLIGNGLIPIGGIAMWSGNMNYYTPQDMNGNNLENWRLCNGIIYNGITTPNMVNKFMVGAGTNSSDKYGIGDEGGADTVGLSVSHLPSHRHSTSSGGAHTHHTIVGRMHSGFDSSPHAIGTDNAPHGTDWSENPTAYNTWTHTHIVDSAGGNHSHNNIPTYYTLAFIMRIE